MSNAGISRWRIWCSLANEWIEAPRQQSFIVAAILLNSFTLGLSAVPALQDRYGEILNLIDHIIIGIFVVEIMLKLLHSGRNFFTNGWNVFDFIIVGISLLPTSGVFSVLRTLRILRALRLLNKLRQLRHIVEAMMRSLPSLGWIAVLLSILFYVFGIIGTTLYGANHPKLFGNLGITLFTLFELMTLEGWNSTAREVMTTHPHAYIFFIPFLLLASYTLLNLVIGVIVTSMEGLHLVVHDTEIEPEPTAKQLMTEIHRLHDKLDILQSRLEEREIETVK
jgi:voltage-gated sodium channel